MRILITGTECTGKSTLAQELSDHLQIAWLPEYARVYLEQHGPTYTEVDLLTIAQEHHRQLTEIDGSVILDTFLLNIKIWSEEKHGRCHPWIEESLSQTAFDTVLLMAPDLPWEQDGLRENPTSAHYLHQRFITEMEALGWRYKLVSGTGQQRLQSALEHL